MFGTLFKLVGVVIVDLRCAKNGEDPDTVEFVEEKEETGEL